MYGKELIIYYKLIEYELSLIRIDFLFSFVSLLLF